MMPPRLGRWILQRVLPRDAADAAIGDLDEEFEQRRSRAWYWRQVFSLTRAYARRDREPRARGAIRQDLRHAFKALRHSRGFAATAIAILALGIGASAAIFSFVNGVLLRPLPYADPARLVQVWETPPNGSRNYVSSLNFIDWKDQNRVFDAIAAYGTGPATLVANGEARQVNSARVSTSYFDVYGARAALGRTFLPEDGKDGRDGSLILSHRFWQKQFAGDLSVIGRAISVDGEPCTIVGVMPADSPFNRGWTDVWRPLRFAPGERTRDYHWLRAVAKLAPGVTFEQAESNMVAIGAGISQANPAIKKDWSVRLDRLADQTVGDDLRQSLRILLGAVVLLLLLGCANLANLSLARGTSREREVVVRAALGASRGRIVRQFLAESLMLSIGGGILGAVTGYALMRGLASLLPPLYLPREATVTMDWRVLAFCTFAAVMTGLLFGIAPAIHASRVDLSNSMRGARGSSTDRAGTRLRHALVVGEVAIASLLLAGTGLLGRSFLAMQQVDVARDPDQVIGTWLIAGSTRFASADDARAYYRRVLERAAAIPGVTASALTTALPLEGYSDRMPFSIAGRPGATGGIGFKRVSPGYFATIGLPIVRGRALNGGDRRGMPPAIVINEAARAQYFPDRDPIGERLLIQDILPGQRALGPEVPWEIVGVVADEHAYGVAEREPWPGAYVPIGQSPSYGLALVLRAPAGMAAVVPSLRAAMKEIDPNQPLGEVRTMADIATAFVAPDRLRTALLTAFAIIALLLAGIGVYGVISYSVAERTREIGIRAALGATRAAILSQVIARVLALALAGVALGLGATLGLGRFLASLLVGVSPRDLPTLAAAAVVLTLTAVVAAWIPARRAATVDPVTALRFE